MTQQDHKEFALLARAIERTNTARAPGFLPEDAPFDADQRNWLNGLFAGLQAIASAATQGGDTAEQAATAMTILYGSQSGTCEALSKDLKKYAKSKGFDAKIAALDDIEVTALADINHLLIVAATFGEGEPADNAQAFHAAIMSDAAPTLGADLNYSVCGLGDSSYAHFNKAARDLDARLAALGATRVQDMVACDVAYEDDYATWKAGVFETAQFAAVAGTAGTVEPDVAKPVFDKNHPFMGTLLHVECLSGAGSSKIVNHIEISLAGGGADLEYRAGDALGVWPVNCGHEVAAILKATGFTGSERVVLKTGPAKLRAALLSRLDLMTVTASTLDVWAVDSPSGSHLIDVLTDAQPDLTPQSLVDSLRPLQPRLYSISSSPEAHPGEVHLTVGEVHYELTSARKGCASTYLGNRLTAGSPVGVYLQKSAHFHLPDNDVPVIMIGPGTGIAPFRAFLEDRQATGATGDNWLFFGDQHVEHDFLYRDQINGWTQTGLLTRASLAWSRDNTAKVYVQDLIRQDGARFYDWLERGAAIYICGDATRMAADVDRTLHDVVAEHGGMSPDDARAFVSDLGKQGRYQRDVY